MRRMGRRLVVYEGIGAWRADVADVQLGAGSLAATGTQIGVEPLPYRLDWELTTGSGFVTRRIAVLATGAGWWRRLELERDDVGRWSAGTASWGDTTLQDPGGDTAGLGAALDCDLGRCPVTNTMPVLRHALHQRPGGVDFTMAWISVPDLRVIPAAQRYEHLAPGRVRYTGSHRGFTGELELDDEGIVTLYPELARRVAG
jgi:uncharacterized protein